MAWESPDAGQLEPFFAALRRRDMAAASAFVAEDVRVEGMALLPLHGRSAWRSYVESFWTAFPDGETAIFSITAQPGSVTIIERLRGTHRGPLRIPPLATVPPTGRRISVGPNRLTFTVRGEKVVRIVAQMQHWQFVRQIGLWHFVRAVLRTPFGG